MALTFARGKENQNKRSARQDYKERLRNDAVERYSQKDGWVLGIIRRMTLAR